VVDERVREPGPVVPRHDLHHFLLDFHRVGLLAESQQSGETLHMRVDDDAFILPEPGAENDVRRFAANAGKRGELFHCLRHFAAMSLGGTLMGGARLYTGGATASEHLLGAIALGRL